MKRTLLLIASAGAVMIAIVSFARQEVEEPHILQLDSRAQILLVLDDIVQAVRTNSVARVAAHCAPEVNIAGREIPSHELTDTFMNMRLNRFSSRLFGIDSIRILISGDSAASVSMRYFREDIDTTRERLHLVNRSGQWQVRRSESLMRALGERPGRPGINAFGSQPAASPVVPVFSQHALIPRQFSSSLWNITSSDAQSQLQRRVFGAIDEFELLPLVSPITNTLGVALDRSWSRIVYGENGEEWIASYGDHASDTTLLDPRGMDAVRFPDGSIRIFVTDAGRKRIVELQYNHSTNALTFVRFLGNGLVTPVDVSVSVFTEGSYFWYTLWVSDVGLGGLVNLNSAGNVLQSIASYSFNNIQFPLDKPFRLTSRVTGVSHNEALGFIDAGAGAFVVLMNGSSAAIAMSTFSPPSKLSGVGWSAHNTFVVADEGLDAVHFFGYDYLASMNSFNSNLAVNSSFFSSVNGLPLFSNPWGATTFDANPGIPMADLFISNSWTPTSGVRRFLPGADIVNFTVSYPPGGIQFNYTATTGCVLSAKIYNSANQVVHDFMIDPVFGPYSIVSAGKRTDAVQWSQLAPGSYTLRLSALPTINNSPYQQHPVEINYQFSSPLSVTMTGPSTVYHGQKGYPANQYTWSASISGGTPNYNYAWRWNGNIVGTNAPSYTGSFGWNGYGGGSYQFTLRVDVTDASNPPKTAYATRTVTAYNSGDVEVERPGKESLETMIPDDYVVNQNFPNPFNPETEIAFGLPEPSLVKITIVDMLGRAVMIIPDREYSAGYQRIVWRGTDSFGNIVGSGVYLCKIDFAGRSGNHSSKVIKMIFTK